MQLVRDMAGLFRCLDHARLQSRKTASRILGRRGIGRKPADVDGQGSKLLADMIVQLARHSPALVFLSGQEAARQSLHFLRVCLRGLLQMRSRLC